MHLKFALLSKMPVKNIIKNTIYRHFCGGTTINESKKTIEKLWLSNIGTIQVLINQKREEILREVEESLESKRVVVQLE